MKFIATILKLLILAFFLFLAVFNTENTVFHYLPQSSVELPLIVLLLAAFAIGALVGVLAMLGRHFSLRGELSRLRRTVRRLEKSVEQVVTDKKETATKPVEEQGKTDGE